jgi:hypothetical protein
MMNCRPFTQGPLASSPEIFGKQIAADLTQWKKVILESRLHLDA